MGRVIQREIMGERYRTLLGHLRHEVGHYFYPYLIVDIPAFSAVFGDPWADYVASLESFYKQGPPPDWAHNYISAYACSHPMEDWAECFAHYLHMQDALGTAAAQGIIANFSEAPMEHQLQAWMELTLDLNELVRSLGLQDAYPFIISPQVASKLEFVHRVIQASS